MTDKVTLENWERYWFTVADYECYATIPNSSKVIEVRVFIRDLLKQAERRGIEKMFAEAESIIKDKDFTFNQGMALDFALIAAQSDLIDKLEGGDNDLPKA